MPILKANGEPYPTTNVHKKGTKPILGEAFGQWAGRQFNPLTSYGTLPGGGLVQFDLSKLTLSDYRVMLDHYQVNSSLAVLSFMLHQSDFHMECTDQKIADFCEETIKNVWTQMNRGLSTANWAGYAPNVLQWENDVNNRSVILGKVKDLIPEECWVNWKEVDGWAPPGNVPPKLRVYDGIRHNSSASYWSDGSGISSGYSGWPIPVDNTLWYPLLMEQGNYYGKKLLRAAFTSWFFSILLHLFANRYYERYGEPTPVGRAPFDEDVSIGPSGVTKLRGNEYLMQVITQLRNRSAVVLPSDRSQLTPTRWDYDYNIEYLESQMRGADFERYLTRLDEEISIGLFTPILLMRTADVGSYNLGVGHMQMYLWMLNAMNDDRKFYLDEFVLSRLVDYNFSEKAPRCKIVFKKMGNQNGEMVSAILTEMTRNNTVKYDMVQLGEMAGLTLEQVAVTLDTAQPGNPPPDNQPAAKPKGKTRQNPGLSSKMLGISAEIIKRVGSQVDRAHRGGDLSKAKINMGYKNKIQAELEESGFTQHLPVADALYKRMDNWVADALMGKYSTSEEFVKLFSTVLNNELVDLYVSDRV